MVFAWHLRELMRRLLESTWGFFNTENDDDSNWNLKGDIERRNGNHEVFVVIKTKMAKGVRLMNNEKSLMKSKTLTKNPGEIINNF